MGTYFMMSFRFNKQYPQDFGLTKINHDIAFNPVDNSKWQAKLLYDFGWGKENGYCKLPIPDFTKLLDIILNSENNEDVYGATAIILDMYSEELLDKCEQLINSDIQSKALKKISALFNLENPINRCNIEQKSYEQIRADFERWKKISEAIKKNNQGRTIR